MATKTRKPARARVKLGGRAPQPPDLLVELLTEELPPKSLRRLAEAFAAGVHDGLSDKGFLTAAVDFKYYATPRRLAVFLPKVLDRQPDRLVERRGPAVSAGFDAAGQPTPALAGFAKSCGVQADRLERQKGDKGEYFVHRFKQKGEALAKHLAAVVETSLKKLPVAKIMRWGAGEAEFVRPVHGLILLHGSRVVPGTVLGLKSGNRTLGHRFLSKGWIAIARATDYEKTLRRRGAVMADYRERMAAIEEQLDRAARKLGATANWRLGHAEELIEEVASLVEYPAVYAGGFSEDFLKIPAECLVTSMQHHQRYFPLARAGRTGELLPQFLFVSNMKAGDPKRIVHGNERVLLARLADARFFFEQDRKTGLAERVPRLASVVFHNKLGSQLARVERIQKLAVEIARRLAVDTRAVEQAAYLSKADLLTDMVGEFPELQGTMGKYYARLSGELAPEAAEAIEQHYQPRSARDRLPENSIGQCLALADRLDTLTGIYGIGLVPTGDKDPFGLRRQALGVIRILLEKTLPLDVLELLELARSYYPNGVVAESVAQDLYGFMLERFKPYLREQGFQPDEIEAVLSLNPTRLDQALRRLRALQLFRRLPEAEALASANKRIRNILRQAGGAPGDSVNPALLQEESEIRLARQVEALRGEVTPLFDAGDYTQALSLLAGLRAVVDEFFDKVMVMVEDAPVRANRLALLKDLSNLFLGVADISRLQS